MGLFQSDIKHKSSIKQISKENGNLKHEENNKMHENYRPSNADRL